MRSFVVIVALGLASPAFADAPRGRYEFDHWVAIEGSKFPSCGPEANAMLDAYTLAHIVVPRDPDRIRVNGETWKTTLVEKLSVIQKPDLGDVFVALRLSHYDNRAYGTLVYARMNADKKPVCVDSRSLSGSYREPPWKFWTG